MISRSSSRGCAVITAVLASPWSCRPCYRRSPAGASALSQRGPAGRPLLRPGTPADPPHDGWLRQFTQDTLAPLVTLNRDLVIEALRACARPCRPDRPHPPAQERTGLTQEPPRQPPWLQAGRPLPAQAHRQLAPPGRPARDMDVRMDAAFFHRGIIEFAPPATARTRSRSGIGAGSRSTDRGRVPTVAARGGGCRRPRGRAGLPQWTTPAALVLYRKHVAADPRGLPVGYVRVRRSPAKLNLFADWG